LPENRHVGRLVRDNARKPAWHRDCGLIDCAMSLNACELEIDLFCRGLRVPTGVSLAGVRGLARTRAGLGSGLEIGRAHV